MGRAWWRCTDTDTVAHRKACDADVDEVVDAMAVVRMDHAPPSGGLGHRHQHRRCFCSSTTARNYFFYPYYSHSGAPVWCRATIFAMVGAAGVTENCGETTADVTVALSVIETGTVTDAKRRTKLWTTAACCRYSRRHLHLTILYICSSQ